MSIITRDGDILDVTSGIICHQVNCMGKMGAGIALQIRNKWPNVYEDYMIAYRRNEPQLGEIILTNINEHLYVASLYGQSNYGSDTQQTIYGAVKDSLIKVNIIANDLKLTIYIPKGMGCGLAGGDWDIVFEIIKETTPHAIIINYNK